MTAIVALPLALAFAVASGVEPKAGLYTAIITGIVAAIFGGSSVQITGPTGAMAVVLMEIVAKYGLEKVWLAGFLAGLIQVILGVVKLGRLAKFIPYPVIAGFTNGIAVIIFCGQLNNFFGLRLPLQENFLLRLWQTFTHWSSINWQAASVGLLVVAIMLWWPKVNQKIPASLVALLAATLCTEFLELPVVTIQNIPQSLPAFRGIPNILDLRLINELMPAAFTLAALGSIESLLSAIVADGMTVDRKHNSNRELIGQGLANMVSPFFGGIPATGAIARTAVNVRAGAKTRLSGVFHGVFLALIVLAFAPLASKIPLAALAGILLVTSYRMIEWEAIKLLTHSTRSDFFVMLITWLITIFFDLILAVEIGLIAAGILFIRRMSDLNLAKMPEEEVLAAGVPLELSRQVAIYRVDGPLFFGVAEKFVNVLHEVPEVKILILRMRYVSNIDSTGLVALEDIYHDLKNHSCRLVLSGMRPHVRDLLLRSGVLKQIGLENDFSTTKEALEKILSGSSIEQNSAGL